MYRVPTMDEINKIPKNGYNVVSLFAGCGGSSLGYKMAGYNVLAAVEFIPIAAENYRVNHPDAIVIEKDVRNVTGKEILEKIGLGVGELDILDGSPPCASFSSVGSKEKGWGKIRKYSETRQRVDDLFFEYIRLVNEIKPKVIVVENVRGITYKYARPVLNEIMEKLGENYNVEYKVLHAKYLGVPQNRPRTIFIGVRKDLGLQPSFPVEDKENIITVREAFYNLKNDEEEVRMLYEEHRKRPRVNEMITRMPKNPEKPIDGTILFNGQRKYFSMIRLSWNHPANTIVEKSGDLTLASGLLHPEEDRKLTIAELKRLQSFPDDFILLGTYRQQHERIARSVPPIMMQKIAENIKVNILDKLNQEDES